MFFIKNQTPYIGKIKLKFEKHPHYKSGSKGMLNKVHLNLGFTKLVSRMVPKNVMDGNSNIDPKKIELIEKYTGGVIGEHRFGKDNQHILENSFLSKSGKYIGNIEDAWWYYKNNFFVCEDYPKGVAEKFKSTDFGNLIVGYYGYSHRGGQLFKIGDRLFDQNYEPKKEDYSEDEWNKWKSDFGRAYDNGDGLTKKWMTDDGIKYVIPFNKRGPKNISTWKEAKQAAINMSKYLS
jgi:hypothetical protein